MVSLVRLSKSDLTAKITVKDYGVTFEGEYDNGDPIEKHFVTYKYGERKLRRKPYQSHFHQQINELYSRLIFHFSIEFINIL